MILLAVAVFVTAAVFWLVLYIFVTVPPSSVGRYSAWIAAAFSTLIFFLTASLLKINLLLGSQKDLLGDEAGRKRAEDELQKNLSLLTSTFEATADGILVVDRNDKIVTYNGHFVNMIQAPDDVIGLMENAKLISFVLDQLVDPESFVENTRQLTLHPENQSYDILEFKDGRIFERYSHPQIMDDEVVGRVVSFRDITERKRAEIASRVISEIIQGVAVTSNLENLLALVQRSIGQAIYAENFYVALYDKQSEFFNIPFFTDKFDVAAPPYKLGKGLTSYVFRTGRPILLTQQDVNRLREQGEIEMVGTPSAIWLGIPLRTPTEVIGVLVVQHYEDESAFTARDLDLLSSAADQIAMAIQRKRAEEELGRSEEKYRTILETIEEGYYELDLAGNFTFVNDAMASLLRYGKDELIGLNYRHYVDAETAEKLFLAYNKVFTTSQAVSNLEFEIIRKDDTKMPSETSIALVRDTAETPIGFRGVVRDVTENRRVEDELRTSEARFHSAFEFAPIGIGLIAPSGHWRQVNQSLCGIIGYTKEELLKTSFQHILHPDDADESQRYLRQLFDGESETFQIENRYIHKLGHEVQALTSISLARDTQNNPLYFISQIQNISERKRVESEIKANDLRLSEAQRIAHLGSWEWDIVENSVAWSDETYRIFGYEPGGVDVSFDFFYNAVHPGDQARVTTVLAETIEQKKALNMEHRIILPDQSQRCLQGRAEIIFDPLTGKAAKLIGTVQDITERKAVEAALSDSEVRYRQLFDSNPHPVFAFDTKTLKFLAVNDETTRRYGYSREELLTMTVKDIRPPEDIPRLLQLVGQSANGQMMHSARHQKKDGTIIDVEVSSHPVTFDGRSALLTLVTDITERKRIDAALRASEYKMRTLFTSMNEGLTQVNNDEVMEFVNDRLCEITGYAREEMLGKKTLDLLFDEEGREIVNKANMERQKGISGQYEARIRKKSGEMIWGLVSGAPIVNDVGELTGTLGMFMDISERKRVEEQLLHDAFHDGLTGLANRALFMDHLRMTIERCKSRHSNHYAVLFLDFDRFKVINDSLGHAEGDELLKQIARRLGCLTRTGDLLARLGGDEFVILLSEMLEVSDATNVAERIQQDLTQPFDLGGNEVFISASIGIALSTDGHKRAEDMLRDADIAMYRAKAKGKARYQVFNRTIRDQATTRLQFETEMRQAIERNEFEMHYQPIINLETRTPSGFEALVRWQHPVRGMISPDDFIPAAEESGLILPLGRWIITESCRQMREWHVDNPSATHLAVNVNLSCKQFLQSDLTEQVEESLRFTGLAARFLKLEITESYLIDNSEKAVKTMNRLRELGVEISLDDFGTGYSSLSYLHRLPVNSLKIDRSFISRMTDSEENYEIVRTIIKLAQNLKMQVVAEGIETADQLAHLNRLHCGFGQGYFFSKPLDSNRATAFIEEILENPLGVPEQHVINLELDM